MVTHEWCLVQLLFISFSLFEFYLYYSSWQPSHISRRLFGLVVLDFVLSLHSQNGECRSSKARNCHIFVFRHETDILRQELSILHYQNHDARGVTLLHRTFIMRGSKKFKEGGGGREVVEGLETPWIQKLINEY